MSKTPFAAGILVATALTLVVSAGAPRAGAAVLAEWECNTFTGWSRDDWGSYYAYTDAGESIFSWGWWGDQAIWRNTGATFAADTVHTLTVRARKGDANNVGVQLALFDVTDGWAPVATHDWDFTLASHGGGSPWESFTLSFDTATRPDLAGHEIGVTVRNRNDGGNGWIHVEEIRLAAGEAAGTTLIVDPARSRQRLDYWGTSLSWWAHGIGDWTNAVKRELLLDLIFNSSYGLGLNYARYHIGGGEDPDSTVWFRPGAKIPGFQPSPGVWDWSADPHQRLVLQGALARGLERVDAFSCSPPYWMTISGSVSGAVDGGNNLQGDMYDDFADYLAEVTRFYRDTHGIHFQTVSPMNEPTGNYWTYGGWQEGCHFDRPSQNLMVKQMGQALAAKGLADVTVGAPEDVSIDEARTSLEAYDSEALSYLGQVHTHTYWGADRTGLAAVAANLGVPLFMSEYGDGTESNFEAMFVTAQQIALDVNVMRANCWTIWALVSATSIGEAAERWCMILANFDGEEAFTVYPKYYGFKQFTANLKPGSVILNPGSGLEHRFLMGLHPDTGRLTVVAINPQDSADPFVMDLSAMPYPIAGADRVRTSTTQNYSVLAPLTVTNNQLTDTLPAKSITSYVMQALPDAGQRWRATTAAEQWDPSGAEMTEASTDAGVHRRSLTLATPPADASAWRVEHAVLTDLAYPTPAINAWFKHASATAVDLYFDESTHADSWLPAANRLYQDPPYVAETYVAVGTFQSEIGDATDWNADSLHTVMRDDGTAGDAVAGDGIYTVRLSIPTPGDYAMIVLPDRDWNTRLTALGPIQDPHHSLEFSIDHPGQTVTLHCDIHHNLIKATPRPAGDWPGLLAALSGPGALPAPDGSHTAQDLLDLYDFDADGDIDLADAAAEAAREHPMGN